MRAQKKQSKHANERKEAIGLFFQFKKKRKDEIKRSTEFWFSVHKFLFFFYFFFCFVYLHENNIAHANERKQKQKFKICHKNPSKKKKNENKKKSTVIKKQ